jgi:hypothetical protein
MQVLVFASYAHRDRDWQLEKFVSALRTELGRRPVFQGEPESVVFFDQDGLRIGDEWHPKLVSKVNSADTLLCLMSPWYFERDWCGRELGSFVARRKKLPGHAVESRFIFPVWWMLPDSPRPLPAALAAHQCADPCFPKDYKSKGVRGLLKGRNTVQFDAMVACLAKLIAGTVEGPLRLPPGDAVSDVRSILNAFDEQQPFDVTIIVSDAAGLDWRPSPLDVTVKQAIASVRARLGVLVRQIQVGANLAQACRQAHADRQLIVVLEVASEQQSPTLTRINQLGLDNVAWLVVDAGTEPLDFAAWQRAVRGLAAVATPGEFGLQLESLVDRARRRLMADAEVRRAESVRLAAGAPTSLPVLTGPGKEAA